MAVYEPLDFAQPQNKLTEVAEQIRKQQIARNDYQLDKQYGAASPDAMSDGDLQGKGTGVFLDTLRGGNSLDMAERKNEIKINQYQANKPYQVPGT
jgi:hypothetical protein